MVDDARLMAAMAMRWSIVGLKPCRSRLNGDVLKPTTAARFHLVEPGHRHPGLEAQSGGRRPNTAPLVHVSAYRPVSDHDLMIGRPCPNFLHLRVLLIALFNHDD